MMLLLVGTREATLPLQHPNWKEPVNFCQDTFHMLIVAAPNPLLIIKRVIRGEIYMSGYLCLP
jgi:hypothetical protein